MMLSKSNSQEIAQARAQIYRLLANVFAKEATIDFLHVIKASPDLFETYGLSFSFDQDDLEPLVEELACEYAALFVGPGEHLSPHESVWKGENRLWGDATVAVNDAYEVCGFEIDPAYKDLPDHISVEFEFMAHACDTEAKRQADDKKELLETVLQIQKEFLKHHLLEWVPAFLDKIIETSEMDYYRCWAKLARAFLLEETQKSE